MEKISIYCQLVRFCSCSKFTPRTDRKTPQEEKSVVVGLPFQKTTHTFDLFCRWARRKALQSAKNIKARPSIIWTLIF